MPTQANKFIDGAIKVAIAFLSVASIAAFNKWSAVEVHMATTELRINSMEERLSRVDFKVDAIGCQQQEILVQLARIGATEDGDGE